MRHRPRMAQKWTNREIGHGLLGALINPGTNQADFFRGQRLWWRTAPAWAARATTRGRSARSARSAVAGSAGTGRRSARSATWSALGRHCNAVVDPRRRGSQETLLAVARNNYLSIAPAFEDGVQTVQAQSAFGLLIAVATYAGGLKEGENIRVKRDPLFIRSGRKFADIDFADVPFVRRRLLSHGRKIGQQQSKNDQSDCMFHFQGAGTMANAPLNARKR